MQKRINRGNDRVANLIDGSPRMTGIANLVTLFSMGVVMGLALSLVAWNITSQFDKPWVYVINTLIALTIKLVCQWFVVLGCVPLIKDIARRVVSRHTQTSQPLPLKDLPDSHLANSVTVTALATMVLATELSKGDVLPFWFIDSVTAAWVVSAVAAMGGLVAILEGLSAPYTIYALAKNRHPYQENMRNQDAKRRNSTRRRNGKPNKRKKR